MVDLTPMLATQFDVLTAMAARVAPLSLDSYAIVADPSVPAARR